MRSLPAFILTRLLSVVLVVAVVATITFVMLHALRPEAFAFETRSLPVELFHYLEGIFLHWDFGLSWEAGNVPVASILNEGLPADVSLLAGGLVAGLGLGMAGGSVCAMRPGSAAARVIETLAAFFIIAPVYWVGLMLLLAFHPGFGPVPIGIFNTNVYEPLTVDPLAWLKSMVIPWLVVGAPLAAMCVRMTRASMTEVLHEEYLRTAKAKGLSEKAVGRRHALPAAASPVFTLVGVNMATMFTNMVLVEHAFSIPGAYQNITDAMNDGNFPLLMGLTVVAAVMVVVANLAVDVAHAYLDPRVRLRTS
jgi:peptide/nickel transport system permease protein